MSILFASRGARCLAGAIGTSVRMSVQLPAGPLRAVMPVLPLTPLPSQILQQQLAVQAALAAVCLPTFVQTGCWLMNRNARRVKKVRLTFPCCCGFRSLTMAYLLAGEPRLPAIQSCGSSEKEKDAAEAACEVPFNKGFCGDNAQANSVLFELRSSSLLAMGQHASILTPAMCDTEHLQQKVV